MWLKRGQWGCMQHFEWLSWEELSTVRAWSFHDLSLTLTLTLTQSSFVGMRPRGGNRARGCTQDTSVLSDVIQHGAIWSELEVLVCPFRCPVKAGMVCC